MAEIGQKLHCRIIIEVLGKPKEHVEEALKNFVAKIKQNQDMEVLVEHFADAKEQDDKLFSTFVELEMKFKNLLTLIGFCFDYMPSSVEIIEPQQLTMKYNEITDMINDLQAKLHNLDMAVKQLRSENNFLKKNTSSLLKNQLMVLLHNAKRSLPELSKLSGVPEQGLKLLLEGLIKEKKIKKQGELYCLV